MKVEKLYVQKTAYLLLLFLCLVSVKTHANAEGYVGKSDSSKNKYAINDPRNSDCPCHTYQKKAEREYKKLLKNQREQTTLILPGKAELNAVKKENDFVTRRSRLAFKQNHKTSSFNRSRKRSKKGIFRIFKKTISDCPF